MNAARPKKPTTGQRIARMALLAGPAATVASILLVHVASLMLRPQDYREAPPSISRIIAHDDIGAPFAWAMLPTAVLILTGIVVCGTAYRKILLPQTPGLSLLMTTVAICELIAVLGMIILSQYRTADWQLQHDFGSYMLFFGHTIGLTLCGVMAHAVGKGQSCSHLLAWAPRAAKVLGLLAIIYGFLYFGGKFIDETQTVFFWRRLALAIWEVLLISYFVWFLWRHTDFVINALGPKAHDLPPDAVPAARGLWS